jgi:hypothetical protein
MSVVQLRKRISAFLEYFYLLCIVNSLVIVGQRVATLLIYVIVPDLFRDLFRERNEGVGRRMVVMVCVWGCIVWNVLYEY